MRRRARVSELEGYAAGGREGSLLRGLVRRLDAISRSPPSDELRREWNSTMKDVGPHLPTKYFAAGLGSGRTGVCRFGIIITIYPPRHAGRRTTRPSAERLPSFAETVPSWSCTPGRQESTDSGV